MLKNNVKRRMSKSRSMEELELGASEHAQTKTRLNVTVLPKTSNWLKGRGNASQTIDELVEAAIAVNLKPADNSSEKLEEQLARENEELKAALNQLQTESEQHQDYQVMRDKVLKELKLGRQAPGYKSALKALDRFIAEIR
jgi:type IV secretory pathway VirB10-like protein